MKLKFNHEGLAVPVSQGMIDLIHQCSNNIIEDSATLDGFTINFKDTSYSASSGGYHPVEIGLFKNAQGIFCLSYITDFAYVGIQYPELIKDVDFNFDAGQLQGYLMNSCLTNNDTQEFYVLWEGNFLSYVDMECFDEVTVHLL
ncbi:DUF2787 family protein [Marinomonas arenicola]|uniref:DUF2787 family protein n=1 Tax=Marinomonas arenicola TaxID=569601 RepID=A0ABU9GAN0_9GAMM